MTREHAEGQTALRFRTVPRRHQLDAFLRHKNAEYFGLFHDMGTGKSKVTIDVLAWNFLKGRVDAFLLIAPNGVHAQWTREQFPQHCPVQWRGFVWDSARLASRLWKKSLQEFAIAQSPGLLKVFAVNVEAFQSESVVPFVADFVKNNRCMIAVDEATRIKTPGAKRTKTVHKLTKHGAIRCVLTGTPAAKSPFDLWSQMEFLRPNYFGCTYFVFQHRYGVLMRGVNPATGGKYHTLVDEKTWASALALIRKIREQRNGPLNAYDYEMVASMRGLSETNVKFIEAHQTFARFKRLDELRGLVARDVSFVRKEECLDLPPKVREVLPVSMSAEQRKVYAQLKKELWAEYGGKEVSVTNKVALTTRLMQVAGGFFPHQVDATQTAGDRQVRYGAARSLPIGETNPKIAALLADLDEVDEDRQVIVWAAFVPELLAIDAALRDAGVSRRLYYGATPMDERRKIQEDFHAGKFRVFVGNAATAGFGLNLQCATIQYFFSNTFKTEDRLQAEDRSHRMGVASSVLLKDIVMRGTVDESVAKSLASGREMNEFFKKASLSDLLDEQLFSAEDPHADDEPTLGQWLGEE